MSKPKTLLESDFTFKNGRQDETDVVAEHQVPEGQVYRIEEGSPLELVINTVKTSTVSSSSTETITLDQAARCEFMQSLDAPSDQRGDADLLVIDSATGDLATDSSDINLSSVSSSGEFYTSVDVENTTGSSRDVELHYVVSKGQGIISKSTPRGRDEEVVQEESALKLAFSDPDDPEADKQLNFEGIRGWTQVIPENFRIQVEFFGRDTDALMEDAENNRLNIQVQSQAISELSQSADEIRKDTKANM